MTEETRFIIRISLTVLFALVILIVGAEGLKTLAPEKSKYRAILGELQKGCVISFLVLAAGLISWALIDAIWSAEFGKK